MSEQTRRNGVAARPQILITGWIWFKVMQTQRLYEESWQLLMLRAPGRGVIYRVAPGPCATPVTGVIPVGWLVTVPLTTLLFWGAPLVVGCGLSHRLHLPFD